MHGGDGARRAWVGDIFAAADRLHDLDAIAVGEDVRRMRAAGHQLAVHFDRDSATDLELREQLAEGRGVGQLPRAAVEEDAHVQRPARRRAPRLGS